MPFPPFHGDGASHEHHLPHIGMRKVKSVLAIFAGFCLWQLLRLVIPGLETHPILIYIYGMIEIRETSEKPRTMAGCGSWPPSRPSLSACPSCC